MKLLYFEDNIIDQKILTRVLRNTNKDAELTCLTSCLGLEEDYINSFDGIIIDQFLGNCSVNEFAKKDIHVPIAMLSASDKNVSLNEFFQPVGLWRKPVTVEMLKEIFQALSIGN